MNDRIMDVIADQTHGRSYKSHRFCYDSFPRSKIEYDETNEAEKWSSKGETADQKDKNINLKDLADNISNDDSLFKYFLDGSRHTYKIDDISYSNTVYPVIAGQIGVGCCSRKNGELKNELFKREIIIALPEKANEDEWHPKEFFNEVNNEVNKIKRLQKINIKIDEIITYNTSLKDKETFENKGIAKIQDKMIELEKDAVSELVSKNKLNYNSYLIKDGSLEYQKMKRYGNNEYANDLTNKKFRNKYKYVIGVSKSFNPTKCYSTDGKMDSNRIAKLKPFERTPVNMYYSTRAGKVWFAVWYVRIRDAKYSSNIFDGILKVEKIIEENDNNEGIPMNTDEVNIITANLLNERNPVCYGADSRWANHIYPIYLTESYVKSKYLSSDLFMELF